MKQEELTSQAEEAKQQKLKNKFATLFVRPNIEVGHRRPPFVF